MWRTRAGSLEAVAGLSQVHSKDLLFGQERGWSVVSAGGSLPACLPLPILVLQECPRRSLCSKQQGTGRSPHPDQVDCNYLEEQLYCTAVCRAPGRRGYPTAPAFCLPLSHEQRWVHCPFTCCSYFNTEPSKRLQTEMKMWISNEPSM